MKLALLVTAYALGMAGTNLLLKMASTATGWAWWGWFAAANAVGFSCVVVMPFALQLAPAPLVYALCIGLGFTALQIGAWAIFREPIAPAQWAGVACVALGLVLLQCK
jgi:multidrug transporter EmrE-like cation transporter